MTIGGPLVAMGLTALTVGATIAADTNRANAGGYRHRHSHRLYRDSGAAVGLGFGAGALTAGALASSYANPFYSYGGYYSGLFGDGYSYGRPGYGYGGY